MTPPPSDPLHRALRELAEADAEEVVALAREQARVRAQKLIEEALLQELLDAVTRLPGAAREPRPTAGQERAFGPRPSDQAWWAYCVLSAADAGDDLPRLAGVEADGAVQVVRDGELAALVSPVPADEYDDERLREHLEDLEWVEQTARRHEAVLETVLQHVTIVPLRLCTIYHDVDGVHRLLRDQAATLAHGLRRIAGSAEWGVKLFAGGPGSEDSGVPQSATPGGPDDSAERPGANYLTQRQHARVRAERASELRGACAEAVHERVSRCAREAVTNPPQRPELHGRELAMILNGAYLVERDRELELRDALASLQAEWGPRGFVLELTGPWPAYNFVSETAGMVP